MNPLPIRLDGSAFAPGELLALYRSMLRIRLVEETIAERYAEQEMRCPVHLSVGQEAAAVGACASLEADDRIVSTHRCHGHYLAKGGDLERMLAELYGKATGCCGGRGGSMHLFDDAAGIVASVPIVASNLPLAAGVALALKQRREPSVAMAFLGDGAVEEGAMHETANLAAVLALPLVFFVENNLYSVYTALEDRQPEGLQVRLAAAYGLPMEEVDGNDVLAVQAAAAAATKRARNGQGPSVIVAHTYRWLEHCGPNDDDPLGYRPVGELDRWRAACPIRRFETALTEAGFLDEATGTRYRREIEAEIDTALIAARNAPLPSPQTVGNHIYA